MKEIEIYKSARVSLRASRGHTPAWIILPALVLAILVCSILGG